MDRVRDMVAALGPQKTRLLQFLERIMRIKAAGLIAFIYIIIISSGLANAFTVSPGVIEIILPAGDSYVGSFKVSNPDDKPVKIMISAEDWSSDQDGRTLKREELPYLSWLRFMPQEAELEPGESREIQYAVNMPPGAKGEYSAMIYFGYAPDPSKKGVSITSRIGNALYVQVSGTQVVLGKISDIAILGSDPLKIDIIIENMGNIHIRPKGNIKVTGEARLLLDIPFNDPGFPVLPQQRYKYEVRLKEKLSAGKYRLDFNMEFDKASFKKEIDFKVDEEGKVLISR